MLMPLVMASDISESSVAPVLSKEVLVLATGAPVHTIRGSGFAMM